jgi:hypothetical protein
MTTTTYTTTNPQTGETITVEKGGRAVRWATWADFGNGFVHLGYSSTDTYAKAIRAGKSNNHYALAYDATELTEVVETVEEVVEEVVEIAPAAEAAELEIVEIAAETETAELVVTVDMQSPTAGIAVIGEVQVKVSREGRCWTVSNPYDDVMVSEDGKVLAKAMAAVLAAAGITRPVACRLNLEY